MDRNSAINLFSIDVSQPNKETNKERLSKIVANTITPNTQMRNNSSPEPEGNRIRNLPPNMNNDGSIPPTTNSLNLLKPVKTAKTGRAELRLIHITRISSAFRTSCKTDKAIHASRNDNQAQPPTSPHNNKLPKDNKNKTQKTPIRTGQNMRLTPRRCPSTISFGEKLVVSNNSKTPER